MDANTKTYKEYVECIEVINYLTQYHNEFTYRVYLKVTNNSTTPSIPLSLLYRCGYVGKSKRAVYYKTNKWNGDIDKMVKDIYRFYMESKRLRRDKKNEAKSRILTPQKIIESQIITLEAAINLLKLHGYKIMKPIQQYEEI